MKLKGKTIDFLGDSITEGHGVTDIENCRYDNIIKKICELKTTHNYGVGGTRIAHQHSVSAKPRHDLCFCARGYDLSREADIIIVFGGTNDYGHGDALFGSLDDKTPDTFCGGVDFLINLLKGEYPESKIVFMTPARRFGDEKPSVDVHKKADAKPLSDYVEVIKEKCVEYGLDYIDIYNELKINPNFEEDRNNYAPDGLHFNDEGQKLLAECVIKHLERL